MNFSLPAGRLPRHPWEDAPLRPPADQLPADHPHQRPWWNPSTMSGNAQFGDCRHAADVSHLYANRAEYEAYQQRVIDIEHSFACDAHTARCAFASEHLRHSLHRGRFVTPSEFGTTPSTAAPTERFLVERLRTDIIRKAMRGDGPG